MLSSLLARAFFLPSGLRAGETVPPAFSAADAAQVPPAAELSAGGALVLGVVEGITEFLPVSSTGHLIIASHALGLESDAPLRDAAGRTLRAGAPSARNPAGEPLTLKLASDAYTVIIQAGAIVAVMLLYWRRLRSMFAGLLGRDAAGLRLVRNISLAVFPAASVGLVLHLLKLDARLFSIEAVVVALVLGALLMFAAERWRRVRRPWPEEQGDAPGARRDVSDLTARQSLGIGLMQCLALWPGTSRSMVTMVGGYFCGLSPARAAEFSFLVGLPTLGGAALLKGVSSGPAMIAVFGWPHVLLGIVAAGVSAALAVTFLVSYLGRHGLGVFAVYRVLLALVLAGWFLV
ncbi:MAG: undecaprenyl-diphosphate phosphatase [Opitutaceae bacterium]|jgi:undecaprenyl-diphosphatase|nr:undecaprenyl-diphosphate phosphatase [Opitutaceae bacterium]